MTTHDDLNPERSEAQEPSVDEALAEFLGLIDETVTSRLTPDEIARRREQLKASRKTGSQNPPATGCQDRAAPLSAPMPASVPEGEWPTAVAITAAARHEAGEILTSARQMGEEYQDAALKRAAKTVAAARREAERILAAARQEADSIVTAAHAEAERTLDGARQYASFIVQAAHGNSPQQPIPPKEVNLDAAGSGRMLLWLDGLPGKLDLSPLTFSRNEAIKVIDTYRKKAAATAENVLGGRSKFSKFFSASGSYWSDSYRQYLTDLPLGRELVHQDPNRTARVFFHSALRDYISNIYASLDRPCLGATVQTWRQGSRHDNVFAYHRTILPLDIDGINAVTRVPANCTCLETMQLIGGTDVHPREMATWLAESAGTQPAAAACDCGTVFAMFVLYGGDLGTLLGPGSRIGAGAGGDPIACLPQWPMAGAPLAVESDRLSEKK